MVMDMETFTEMAVHLKLASDAILKVARHLAVISEATNRPDLEEHWTETLDSLLSTNAEVTVMEKLLRAIMEANQEEKGCSQKNPKQ